MREWRLCHTSDWHLGHTLRGRSREWEHRRFFTWLVELIEREDVDVLVVAGDVFDTASPPGSAQQLLYRFLAELRAKRPRTEVIVVAGNHDSPARLAAPDPLLRAQGVRIVGTVGWSREAGVEQLDAGALVVPVRVGGEEVAQVAAVPFLRAADLPAGHASIAEGVSALYRRVLDAARMAGPGQALIATAHCEMAGAQLSAESERTLLGGHASALPASVFPDDVAYVALGHLHLAQRVGGSRHIAYSGSPIPLALGEESYPHQVIVATFRGAELAHVASHLVPRAVPILRLPKAGPAPLAEVLAELSALEVPEVPLEARPWLEVRVRLSRPEPSLRASVEGALAGKAVRLVAITAEHPRRERTSGLADLGRDLSELDPRAVLRRKWARDYDGELPAELAAAFDQALERAWARLAEERGA